MDKNTIKKYFENCTKNEEWDEVFCSSLGRSEKMIVASQLLVLLGNMKNLGLKLFFQKMWEKDKLPTFLRFQRVRCTK